MLRLFWCASQPCGHQAGLSPCAWFALGFRRAPQQQHGSLQREDKSQFVAVRWCTRTYRGAATLSGRPDRCKNFAPLQERCFTQTSQALICQQICSEVTAANCWKWEQECNYQWEWDMKLVCYIKWAEGRSWCSSKIFNSHINVNYKKQNPLNVMMIMGPSQSRYNVVVGHSNEDSLLMVWSLLVAEWTELCYAWQLYPETLGLRTRLRTD